MLSLEKFSHYKLSVTLNDKIFEVKRYSYESINCIYDVDIFSNGIIRYITNGKNAVKNHIHDRIINHYNIK